MSRFDGLAAIALYGQSSRPCAPSQGRFGFRNAQGEIVLVPAQVARVVDPKEMFNVQDR